MSEFPGEHGGFLALPEQSSQVPDQALAQPARARQICLMAHRSLYNTLYSIESVTVRNIRRSVFPEAAID